MRRIAIANQKGGVGKTTTAANLGACLALLNRRVLLIDVDPQANASVHLGIGVARGEASTYTLLRGESTLEETIRDTMLQALRIIPSNIDLAGLEVELSAEGAGRERCLAKALQELGEPLDFVLVDCPPSLGLLTLNALCAVEEVFIPLQTEFFALQGLGRLINTVQLVRASLNPRLELTGIIAVMFDVRTALGLEVIQDIKEHFGDRVFETVVRKNIQLAEAPSFGLPITHYDITCFGTEDYRSLALEVLAKAGERTDIPIRDNSIPPLPAEALAGAEQERAEVGAYNVAA